MCHTVNADVDWRCGRCGYEFGQPIEKVRELLRDQLRGARIAFWILLVLILAAFAGPGYLAYAGRAW